MARDYWTSSSDGSSTLRGFPDRSKVPEPPSSGHRVGAPERRVGGMPLHLNPHGNASSRPGSLSPRPAVAGVRLAIQQAHWSRQRPGVNGSIGSVQVTATWFAQSGCVARAERPWDPLARRLRPGSFRVSVDGTERVGQFAVSPGSTRRPASGLIHRQRSSAGFLPQGVDAELQVAGRRCNGRPLLSAWS